MRDIKFRGWDKYNNRVVDIGDLETISVNKDLDFANYEVMQFTGLKDKNGKEIYEGDIVRGVEPVAILKGTDPGIAVVEWLEEVEIDRFWWNMTGFSIYLKPGNGEAESNNLEVIGNIYENPELIEKIEKGGQD